MRILTIASLYPNAVMPTRGVFTENRLLRIAKTRRASFRVIAPVPWFPFKNRNFGQYARFAAVPMEELRAGITVSHPRYLVIPKIATGLQSDSYLRALFKELRRLTADGDEFDLIDAHYLYPDGVAAARLARKIGKPVVISALGTDLNMIAALPGPDRQIRAAFRSIDGLITVSAALGRRAQELGMPQGRISVLRNGVDCDLFRPIGGARSRVAAADASPLILSVANLVSLKGHDLTIRALRKLKDAHLLLVGEGPERGHLAALAKRLEVENRVHFLGALAHEDLPAVYSAADVLVLASAQEGWPNVLLEAMACGTPVIATKVGGIPEIVGPKAGLMIEQRTPEAIAAAIGELLASPPDREHVRQHAQGYGWDDVISRQLALYEQVIEEARAR